MIEQLIARGAEVSAVNNRGQTPLLVILTDCYGMHNITDVRRAIKVLLRCESEMRLSDKEDNTALHLAISQGRSLPQLIIENGGNVNAVDGHGCTPLRAAYTSLTTCTLYQRSKHSFKSRGQCSLQRSAGEYTPSVALHAHVAAMTLPSYN